MGGVAPRRARRWLAYGFLPPSVGAAAAAAEITGRALTETDHSWTDYKITIRQLRPRAY